jgi:hypothetical protein
VSDREAAFDRRIWTLLKRRAQQEGRDDIERELEREARQRSAVAILKACKARGYWWPGDD